MYVSSRFSSFCTEPAGRHLPRRAPGLGVRPFRLYRTEAGRERFQHPPPISTGGRSGERARRVDDRQPNGVRATAAHQAQSPPLTSSSIYRTKIQSPPAHTGGLFLYKKITRTNVRARSLIVCRSAAVAFREVHR